VKKIYVPTHGLTFAQPEMVRNAERYRGQVDGLSQFDALERASQTDVRAAIRAARLEGGEGAQSRGPCRLQLP